MNVLVAETILIVLLGLIPALLSIIAIRRTKRRWQTRFRQARTASFYRQVRSSYLSTPNEAAPKPFVGDTSCRFNARSPYLRCAVNPDGPCEECIHYETK
ncbi:MAG: DUF6464 family protein [Cyanophyceae cyanobacterium]